MKRHEIAPEDRAFGDKEGPRLRPAAARVITAFLVLYLIGLGFVGAWPTPVDRPLAGPLKDLIEAVRGFPPTAGITYMHVEGAANVVLFFPLGLMVALLLPIRRWWLAGVAGALISAAIETVQYLALSQRQASLGDILYNTLGAALGALAIRVVRTRAAHPTTQDPLRNPLPGGKP
ncbi:MAG: VanZ family protein [Arthrobacter sp.]